MIKINEVLKKIRYFFSKEKCYDEMVKRDYAEGGECQGLAGGDRTHNYLSEMCWDCPYLDWNVAIKGRNK